MTYLPKSRLEQMCTDITHLPGSSSDVDIFCICFSAATPTASTTLTTTVPIQTTATPTASTTLTTTLTTRTTALTTTVPIQTTATSTTTSVSTTLIATKTPAPSTTTSDFQAPVMDHDPIVLSTVQMKRKDHPGLKELTTNGTTTDTTVIIELPTTTAPPTTTESPLPCAKKPCGRSTAQCINLYQDYRCQCPYGYYYAPELCKEGRVFPGRFTLNVIYDANMAIVNSLEYAKLYRNVTDFFNTTFENEKDFEETIIVNVTQVLAKAKIQSRAATSKTEVTVMNIFNMNINLNSTDVADLITAAMNNTLMFISNSYVALRSCDVYSCDEATTTCDEPDGTPTCNCKQGLSKKNTDDRACLACDSTCSEENNTHCFVDKNRIPVCQCLPNFKKKDGKCVACALGYSGVNCSNSFLLILIIVAVICGAVILGLIIGLICTSRRTKRPRNPEKRNLLKEDYSNKREPRGLTSATKSAANDKIFPMIQTSSAAQENRGFEVSNGPPARRLPAANEKIFPMIQTSNAHPENRGFERSNGLPARRLPAANERAFPTIQTSYAHPENRGFERSNPYVIASPASTLPEADYDDDDDEDEEYEMSSRDDVYGFQRKY
ncbi:mucin-13 isoform X2 [Emydura macquarii macquarii]|uniref:mucin-13 isoform X2 n=1 Tax=Emydura macquarii macquarii TaxID=1129001 RepID=UPI003529E953